MNNNPLPTPIDAPMLAEASQSKRVKKRVLWGCGCGCLLPMFLVAILFVWGASYIQSPGEQIAPQRLLTEASVGFIQVTPENGRQAMSEWLGEIVAELGRLDPDDFSDPDQVDLREFLQSLQGVSAESVAEYIDFAPNSFTVALAFDSVNNAQLTAMSALNLQFGGKFFHWLFEYVGEDIPDSFESDGTLILPLGNGAGSASKWYVAFAKDTPVLSNNLPLLKRSLKELMTSEEDVPQPSPELARMQTDWADLKSHAFLGATLGYHERLTAGQVRSWFGGLASMVGRDFAGDVTQWPDVGLDHLRLEMQPDGDDATARLELFGVNPEDMLACEAFVDDWMAGIQAQLESEGLDVAIDRLSVPGNLVLDLRLNEFKAWLVARVVGQVEAQASHSSQPQD